MFFRGPSRPRLSRRLSQIFFLAAIFALPAAVGAADAPAPTFKPAEVTNTSTADSAPSERRLQEVAQEILDLSITSVETQPLKGDAGPGSLSVVAKATIVSVLRTTTDLKAGDKITIAYTHLRPLPGKTAPPIVPVVKEGTEYVAYLFGPLPNGYAPFAGSSSFVDPATAKAVAAAPPVAPARNTPAPVSNAPIDAELLPTPQNPAPAGVVKMTGDALKKWAPMLQANNKWYASLANSKLPFPLQVSGNGTPAPIGYYLAPLRAPLSQPTVFVYQAGTRDTGNPVLGVVNVERALIIDRQGRLLGDALWAYRTDKPVLVPLPDWHWLPHKLEVEDPFDQSVQHISLVYEEPRK